MIAVKVFEKSTSEVLKLVEVEKPKIKEGWSLIKVKGFSMNRSEIFIKEGWLRTEKGETNDLAIVKAIKYELNLKKYLNWTRYKKHMTI